MKVTAVSILILLLCLVFGAHCHAEESAMPEEQKTDQHGNPVVFWELASHDAERSVGFFKKTFDWEIEKVPNTILYGVDSRTEDQGISGGIFTLRKARLPFLTIYILVDDIEEKARLIEKNGGLIIEPPHEISSGSWICLFNDPSGVTFAMLQRAPVK
jgi:predicted enzyme related to lactoylglutathione lyase